MLLLFFLSYNYFYRFAAIFALFFFVVFLFHLLLN